MTSSSNMFASVVVAVLSFQMVLSAPILSAATTSNSDNKKFLQEQETLPAFQYPSREDLEMLKRDFEEPIFIDPPESDQFAVFYNLPRTDRKNLMFSNFFEDSNQMFPSFNGENPFEKLPIDPRSIPMEDEDVEVAEPKLSPPSQKELLGPIVVGPQTKSTQTSSLKKVQIMK